MSIANYFSGVHYIRKDYQILGIGMGMSGGFDDRHVASRLPLGSDSRGSDKWYFIGGVVANALWIGLPAYWIYRKFWPTEQPVTLSAEGEATTDDKDGDITREGELSVDNEKKEDSRLPLIFTLSTLAIIAVALWFCYSGSLPEQKSDAENNSVPDLE